MGSPETRLNIPEHLRPWHDLGVSYLMGYDNPQLAAPAPAPARRPQQPQRQGMPPRQQQGNRPMSNQRQPQQGGQPMGQNPNAPQQNFQQRPSGNASAQGQGRNPAASGMNRSGQQPSAARPNITLPPESPTPVRPEMPEPWNTFLTIAPPAPKVAITYYELGLDLGGRADASRRALFRAMLMYLAWPKGTALFLPCTALDGNTLVPGPEQFWRIVRSYGIRQIGCFGEPAQRVIAPKARADQYRIKIDTVSINLFPAPFELGNLKSHERRLAISPLRDLRFS